MTIPEAIEEVISLYADLPYLLPPEKINRGECWGFAKKVRRRVGVEVIGDSRCSPEDIRHITECGHVWVTDGEKHYDAENPQGVDDWRDLHVFNCPFERFQSREEAG